MAVTSHDVARLAGVSQPTVSRALRDEPRVSIETRTRVREAARELGYVPHSAGRSLSTLSSGRIGIVSAELRNPFYPALIAPLHEALSERGYRTILITDQGADPIRIEALVDGSLDGVILTTSELDSPVPGDLVRRGLPVVLVNRLVDGLAVDSCATDDFGGGKLIAGLFLRLGHTRIAAINGLQGTSTGREGTRGFMAALADAGVAVAPADMRTGPFTTDFGEQALTALMAQDDPPTAVYCANDVVAIGALNACARMGLRVPRDVTIVGLDDIESAAWPTINLTTVRTDMDALARAAADLVVARIKDPRLPAASHVQPVTLVERGTHGPPARR